MIVLSHARYVYHRTTSSSLRGVVRCGGCLQKKVLPDKTACFFISNVSLRSIGTKNKVGIGGNNWSRMDPSQYQRVIAKSLEHGISVIEAGQEGGDKALLEAYNEAVSNMSEGGGSRLTMTMRIGYRTIMPSPNIIQEEQFPGDVPVEQHPFLGFNRTMAPLDEDQPPPSPSSSSTASASQSQQGDKMIQVFHNTSPSYIQHQLATSPLVREYQNLKNNYGSTVQVIPLLHNPEAQIMLLAYHQDINQVSIQDRQQFLRDRLVEAFCAMEQAVADHQIPGYGITSNGLGLPLEHPLSLSPDTILHAIDLTRENMGGACNFSVLQLPINLMERTGLDTARELHRKIQNDELYQHLKRLEIYAMRPLTCYPDRGTGTGHPFRLIDYLLPTGAQPQRQLGDDDSSKIEQGVPEHDEQFKVEEFASKQWTDQMNGPPLAYSIALKDAMQHFDASALLEEKMKRDLTPEERETLDGCKLLQSMLHDLDVGLEKVRSLGQYEEHLYKQIIPLIHDTFEGYDERTADVLEMFFKSLSLAVRYSIARNTRQLLKAGGDDGKGYHYDSIPKEEKLQDYALKYLMKEDAISKVIVGATKPEHVVNIITLCQKLDDELSSSKDTAEKEQNGEKS